MTSDAGGGVYWGPVSSYKEDADGKVTINMAHIGYGTQPGGAMCVLQGTGTGECRRVVVSANHSTNYTIGWSPNKRFSVPLDHTSMINIMPYQGKIAFNRNRYR